MKTPAKYQAPRLTTLGRIHSHANLSGGPIVLADVESESGWRLRITRAGKTLNAALAHATSGRSSTYMFWSTLDRLWESVSTHLTLLGEAPTAKVLRALFDAEMRR